MSYKLGCEDLVNMFVFYMCYLHSFSGEDLVNMFVFYTCYLRSFSDEDLVNMFMIHLICIHSHVWFNCDSTFVMFFSNWDFNLNLFIKSISCDLLFLLLVSFNMLILKFLKVMRGQSFANFWTKAFNVLKNIEIKWEWLLWTHIWYELFFIFLWQL
jgi:hypothetical protein